VAPLASSGCRIGTAPATGQQAYDAAGEDGSYIEAVPPSRSRSHPLSLVVDLHGYLETASLQEGISLDHSSDPRLTAELGPGC
jgi:poly(3-hydroxybutyrate) depolymerase